jgi:hypothetical protein
MADVKDSKGGRIKINIVQFEIEGSDETIQEGIHALNEVVRSFPQSRPTLQQPSPQRLPPVIEFEREEGSVNGELVMDGEEIVLPQGTSAAEAPVPVSDQTHARAKMSIRDFVNSKSPTKDTHFVATVAYYYQFLAPDGERKDFISSADLQEACRLVSRKRLTHPGQTLRNAHTGGLMDKGSALGQYTLSTVGENLVAMTLPMSGNSNGKKHSQNE